MLLPLDPVSVVDVAVLEDVLAVAVALVAAELAHVLVTLVAARSPPELPEACAIQYSKKRTTTCIVHNTLLDAVDVVALVAVPVGEEVQPVSVPATLNINTAQAEEKLFC